MRTRSVCRKASFKRRSGRLIERGPGHVNLPRNVLPAELHAHEALKMWQPADAANTLCFKYQRWPRRWRFHEFPRTTSRIHCATGTTSALEHLAARPGHSHRQRFGGDAGAGHDRQRARLFAGKRDRRALRTDPDSGHRRCRRVGAAPAPPDPPPRGRNRRSRLPAIRAAPHHLHRARRPGSLYRTSGRGHARSRPIRRAQANGHRRASLDLAGHLRSALSPCWSG